MKRNHGWPAYLLISLLCAATNAAALRAQETALPAVTVAVDPGKAALIRQVIDATGAPAVAADNLAAGIEKARADSELPEIVWQHLLAKIDPKELFELIAPIYDAHYTKAEIQVLLDFYRSPTGKKFLVEMPKVNDEIDAAGEHWAEEIAASLMQELLSLAEQREETTTPEP